MCSPDPLPGIEVVILKVDQNAAQSKSRLAAHRIIGFALRYMEIWQQSCGGYKEAMVLMAVVAITGDRLTRLDERGLSDMSVPVPPCELGQCHLSSIASATGLNRETARRVVARLIARGILIRSEQGLVQFVAGHIQRDPAKSLNAKQIEEFCRTANLMLQDGIIELLE
jgi:hypothetical protein